MRIARFFLGFLLLPVCVAATQTLGSLLSALRPPDPSAVPPSAWALGGGFGLWLLVYATMSRPVRTYVLAHELTHALWGSLMGARVSRLRVARDGGSVTLSRSNALIALAPYFFPLYTMLLIAAYAVLSVFYAVERYQLLWLALVGFTWGFHFTFTITTLLQQQKDIREYGRLFSYAVIYLFNVLGIGLWIVAVSPASLEEMVGLIGRHTRAVGVVVWDGIGRILAYTVQ
jgi:hypothetical protein